MTERDARERDILVASNEFAYVQDLTKGDIVLYVGPTKISLSNTERLVDFKHDRFVPLKPDDGSGVSPVVTATSSEYIVLENPAKDPLARALKGHNPAIPLEVGKKIVVPGPAAFPLWPGQKANVVGGRELREDEYLVVRVYEQIDGDSRPIGTHVIVRGTCFYVPTTGLEVLVAAGVGYVRKAHRLRKGTGLHLRVVQSFAAGAGEQLPEGNYEAGQDVFLADREGYFFPTDQIEVIGLVVAIPLGEREGLYARDLLTGKVATIIGPTNHLPDPTKVEIVSRELPGEIAVQVQAGVAVLVTAKDRREVVRGPVTRILDFDEDLEVLTLSTGKPKSNEKQLQTSFLQIDGNKVSDVVRLKTKDHSELQATLSYRVSFADNGDVTRWFRVKDYVGLLCDHLASLLRATTRAMPLETFYGQSTEILRRAILGDKPEGGSRAGRSFDENGMWVYDVEVLDVRILDEDVKGLLEGAQKNAILAEVARRQEELRLDAERLKERVNRDIYQARIETLATSLDLERAQRLLCEAEVATKVTLDRADKLGRATNDADTLGIASLARNAAAERDAVLSERALVAKVSAFKEQMAALSPELVATLKTLGHQHFAAELSKNVSPLAILGGASVTDVVERLLGSLPIGTGEPLARTLPAKAK